MEPEEDAYGRALRAHYEGEESFEIVERDDGYVGPGAEPGTYFAAYDEWPARQREAIGRARGRVLDVGCGAGRHALYLQERGHDAVGIDASPGAVAGDRDRGLDRAGVRDVADVRDLDGGFDTVVLFGNNFGLVGTRERAPAVLGALADVTAPEATLLAESRDPYETDEPAHLHYHELNGERGRLPGALRIRVQFKRAATDWFDYLLASPDEMRYLVSDTSWRVTEVIEGEDDPGYVGVLEKG